MTATPPPTMCSHCNFHNPHHRPDCPHVVKAQARTSPGPTTHTEVGDGDGDENYVPMFSTEPAEPAAMSAEEVLFAETIARDPVLQRAIADRVEDVTSPEPPPDVGVVIEEAARPFDEHDHPSNCPDCGGWGQDLDLHRPGCRWRCQTIKVGVQCNRVSHGGGILFCLFNIDEVIEATAPQVDHPDHYNAGGIECIDAIRAALTAEEFAGFCKGNALKYIWRERHKNGPVDMLKAQWYLEALGKVS